jgi:NTE family protein
MPNVSDLKPKIALTLSGGGYRATLFALGALQRLNEAGFLRRINTITSVSGGSIASGFLAKNWKKLDFDDSGVATNFEAVITIPLKRFCSTSIDVKSVLGGLFSFSDTIGDKVAKAYDDRLFNEFMLKEIAQYNDAPLFIFYGTNYQTGSSIRMSQHYISDWRLGINRIDDISLAKVVGISSAFPPLLSPVTLKLTASNWEKTQYATHFHDEKLKSSLLLTDGGLYDNLGLEAVTKDNEYQYVLCCDAGAPFNVGSKMKTNWISQFTRMTDLMISQQRALRKRMLMKDYKNKDLCGGYFGIGTEISQYVKKASLPFEPRMNDSDMTKKLKEVPTRLNAFDEVTQNNLIRWGDALCDATINCWCAELSQI